MSRRYTHLYAVPGSMHAIDFFDPETGLTYIKGETLEEIRRREPKAEAMTFEEHSRAIAEKQDTPIRWEDSTEENFWYSLECVPPAIQRGGGFLVGEPYDHHAVTGQPRFTAYRERDGKFEKSNRPMTVAEYLGEIEGRSA